VFRTLEFKINLIKKNSTFSKFKIGNGLAVQQPNNGLCLYEKINELPNINDFSSIKCIKFLRNTFVETFNNSNYYIGLFNSDNYEATYNIEIQVKYNEISIGINIFIIFTLVMILVISLLIIYIIYLMYSFKKFKDSVKPNFSHTQIDDLNQEI
jgi:hypothetical protein